MAEGTGISSHHTPGARPAPGGGLTKNRKGLMLAGGAVVLFLVLGKKGGNTAATDPNAQLQANADQLAAAQSAALPPQPVYSGGNGSGYPGGGGGSPTVTGDTAPPAATPGYTPADPAYVSGLPDITGPAGPAGTPGAPGKAGKRGTPGKRGKPGPAAKPAGKSKPGAKKAPQKGLTKGGLTGKLHTSGPNVPKPKTPPKGKPAPASSKAPAAGGGQSPNPPGAGAAPKQAPGKGGTAKKTKSGTKKRSPALVESMEGAGSGQLVMGRHFPGAVAHRLGPPQLLSDGTPSRTVTIDYGGRTEVHRWFGGSQRHWMDLEPGMNPPSRGVANHHQGHPV